MTNRRVTLHVGAPKSGTTYVQSRLQRNRGTLADHGVLVPQADERDGAATLAFRAALDLTGVRLGRGRRYTDGRWDQLVARAAAHRGDVVVSDEAFVRADATAAARAVAELGGDDAQVHVVYTARDLARQLVSGWLENLKHGGSEPFGRYLARARAGDLRALRTYDLAAVLGRWSEAARPLGDRARVHLVTVPPEGADRSLLWTRFLAAAGVDPAWTPAPAARSNDAIGLAEAQFLRALNEHLGGAAKRGRPRHRVVHDVVVGEGLSTRDSPRVRLDPDHAGWVDGLTATWLAWVRAGDVDVVGDLDDLLPAPDRSAWVDPDVPVADSLVAADAALAAVHRARRRGRGAP